MIEKFRKNKKKLAPNFDRNVRLLTYATNITNTLI